MPHCEIAPALKLLITHAAYLLMRGAHDRGEADMIAAHFRQVLPMVIEYLQGDDQPTRIGALAHGPMTANQPSRQASAQLVLTCAANNQFSRQPSLVTP